MSRTRAVVAAILAALAAAAPAAAATGPGIGLEPSRVEATVHRGGTTPAISITNRTRRPVAVVVQPYPARQARSGLPEYDSTAAGRAAGDRLLAVAPRAFTLAPGASRRVRATVLACPQTGLGTYGVMEFAVRDAETSGAGITTQLRLTAPLLLRYAPRPCYEGEVTGVRAEQAGRGRLTFFADVRNSGNLHMKTVTTLRILRAGLPVFEGRFPSENVLPQAVREFALPFTGKLPAGQYTAVATSRIGGRASRRSLRLRLTGVNTLPTPRLRLSDLRVEGARRGSSPRVAGTVASRGTAPAAGSVRVSLTRSGLGAASESRTIAVGRLAPGGTRDFDARLPPLDGGRWAVTAVLRTGGRETDRRTVTFTVRAAPAGSARWRDWAAAHIDTVLGATGAGLVIVALAAGLLARRRRVAHPHVVTAPADELAAIRAALARMEARVAARETPALASEPEREPAPPFVARTAPPPPRKQSKTKNRRRSGRR